MNILTHECELFVMKIKENVYDMNKHFIHIFNHTRTLGKVFQNKDLVVKIIICLNHSWQPKVIGISKSRDFSSMEMATIFGKFQEHEINWKILANNE